MLLRQLYKANVLIELTFLITNRQREKYIKWNKWSFHHFSTKKFMNRCDESSYNYKEMIFLLESIGLCFQAI